MVRFLAAFVLASLWTGCPRHTRGEWHVREGSCENVCARYLSCKGTGDPALRSECDSDCRFIYHSEGRAQTESLAELQSLDCDKLLSFIEGDGGRALGEAPPPRPTNDEAMSESRTDDARGPQSN